MGILKYIRRIAIFIFILNCQPFRAILKKKINNKIVPNTVMRKNNLWNKVFSWLTPFWIKCLLCMEHFELLFNLYRSVSIYQRLILLLFFLRNLYMLWMTKNCYFTTLMILLKSIRTTSFDKIHLYKSILDKVAINLYIFHTISSQYQYIFYVWKTLHLK